MLEIVPADCLDDARYAIRIGRIAGYARFELQAACAVVDAYPVKRMAAELIVADAEFAALYGRVAYGANVCRPHAERLGDA
ncbi:hypothetical protein KPA97_67150, partial [Burkholderia cenocepacia]|nr:hypothetical protein [Burkholderia cenocepacia]